MIHFFVAMFYFIIKSIYVKRNAANKELSAYLNETIFRMSLYSVQPFKLKVHLCVFSPLHCL